MFDKRDIPVGRRSTSNRVFSVTVGASLFFLIAAFLMWISEGEHRKPGGGVGDAAVSGEAPTESSQAGKKEDKFNDSGLLSDGTILATRHVAEVPGQYSPDLQHFEITEFSSFSPRIRKFPDPPRYAQRDGRILYGPLRVVEGEILPNQFFSMSLDEKGVDYAITNLIVQTLKGQFDFRDSRPGHRWRLEFDTAGRLIDFTYTLHERRRYRATLAPDGKLVSWEEKEESELVTVQVGGRVLSNLSNAVALQGEGVALAVALAEVFAWDIDFSSECRKGDTFKAIFEKYVYKGHTVAYGRVLAAQYTGSFTGERFAYHFESADGKVSDYYLPDGKSVRKTFLRAPLNTVRVTSQFGFRMHPTLHKRKKHNGVDYGAPRGTSVWAAADGTVTGAGWMGPCGKGVTIRHANGYASVYCHLSRIHVQRGQRVKQKRVIGQVGSTGRSTGPHLHYGLKENGRWINPLKAKFRPGPPLKKEYMPEFSTCMAEREWVLSNVPISIALGPEPPGGATLDDDGCTVVQESSPLGLEDEDSASLPETN